MARHTRYPAGRDWLPEAFKQTAASSHPYQEPTTEEKIMQWYRMYVDRKISLEAMLTALDDFPEEDMDAFTDKHKELFLTVEDVVMPEELFRESIRPHVGRIWS